MMTPTWFSQQRLDAVNDASRGQEIYAEGGSAATAIGRNESLSTKAKDQQLKDLVERMNATIGPLLLGVQKIVATVRDQCRYASDPLIAFRAARLAGVKPEALVPVLAEVMALPESALPLQLEDALQSNDWIRAYAIAMRNGDLAASLPINQDAKAILEIIEGAEAELEDCFRHGQGLSTAPGALLHSSKGLELGLKAQRGRDAAARLDGNSPSDSFASQMGTLASQRLTA